MIPSHAASFAELDRRARAGETLTAVYFGCSLTWGANSTDPMERSYRAHVSRRLAERYPLARWRFVDAAIGGTDSRLGAFRFERDVARHRPDLVFVDFTLNDGAEAADPDRLASYEAIVRRAIGELHACTMLVLLCDRAMVACLDLERFRTRTAHLELAERYQAGVGDAFALMQDRHRSGRLDLARAWDDPADSCHPGDLGYELYAEAVWSGFEEAVGRRLAGNVPERMLHRDTYLGVVRGRLADLASMPAGWKLGQPTRISAWYDSLMSRWLDSEAIAMASPSDALPGAWSFRFRGSTVLLLGESTSASGRLEVTIDGRPAPECAGGIVDCGNPFHGTVRLAVVLAIGLDPRVDHRLDVRPIRDRPGNLEWRLESICIAGQGAALACAE